MSTSTEKVESGFPFVSRKRVSGWWLYSSELGYSGGFNANAAPETWPASSKKSLESIIIGKVRGRPGSGGLGRDQLFKVVVVPRIIFLGAGLGVGFGMTLFITGEGLLTVMSTPGSLVSWESAAIVCEGALSKLATVETFDFWLMHPAARNIMTVVAEAIAKAVPLFILSSFGIGVVGCYAVLTLAALGGALNTHRFRSVQNPLKFDGFCQNWRLLHAFSHLLHDLLRECLPRNENRCWLAYPHFSLTVCCAPVHGSLPALRLPCLWSGSRHPARRPPLRPPWQKTVPRGS